MNLDHYPRISDIMHIWSKDVFDSIDPEVLEKACERGTAVHAYCTAYAKGLNAFDPEEDYNGYVDSFKLWYDENVEELISSETRLYETELEFSGKYDLIVRLKGEESHTLVDIKTSAAYQREWPVKLAGYLHLINFNKQNVFHAISLRLKKDGKKPCAKDFGDCNLYYRIFLSALNSYDYFIRRKEASDVSFRT